MCVSSQCHLPCLECLDPFDQSDLDDVEDVVDNQTSIALETMLWGR